RSKGPIPSLAAPGIFSDIFGLGKNQPTREETKARKARMDEFYQIVDLPTPAAAADALNSSLAGKLPVENLPPPPTSAANSPNSLGALTDLPRRIANPLGGMEGQSSLIGGTSVGALPEVNTKGLGQASLEPLQPKVEPPKLTPPAPSFTAPKRPF